MECIHCKGKLIRSTAPLSMERRGYHIRWDEIPAWVCTQCGEPLFEEREVARIQEVLVFLDEQSHVLHSAA